MDTRRAALRLGVPGRRLEAQMLEKDRGQPEGLPELAPTDTEHVRFADLGRMAADLSSVDQVIAPLFGHGFDAYELIQTLGNAGFSGRLCVRSDRLAHRGLVLRELRDVAEPYGIRVDLCERADRASLPGRLLRRLLG
jgi:hypothetical protein